MISVFFFAAIRTFSPATFAFALFVVSGAAYLRQVMNFVLEVLRSAAIGPLIWIGFACMGAALFWLLRRGAAGRPLRLALAGAIFVAGLVASAGLEMAVERVHLLFFGVLGFLAARDAARRHEPENFPWLLPFVWFFCLAVAALDEGFQYFLPYRVGDPRDVLFGALGGFWGMAIFAAGAGTVRSPDARA